MASEYPCDNDDGLMAVFTVSNQTNGDTKFWCLMCTAMFGTAMLREAFPEIYAEMTKADATPEKAPAKRAPKKAAAAKVDPNRTIATITEDQPRPPGSDAAEHQPDPPY